MDYLDILEAEALYIFREAVAGSKKPVMLYSVGKDSSVLLHLARKAFAPGKIPFPVMHINTGYKFTEMIIFRDNCVQKFNLDLIEERNTDAEAQALGPDDAHTDRYIYLKKTKPLLDTLQKHTFDLAFGGARRDEEKSRAKERIFSVRNSTHAWDPKNQRPELWHLYNTHMVAGQTMRVFPLSNWTEVDIWRYIQREKIDVVPLYFAEKRQLVMRNGLYYRVDEFVKPRVGEEVIEAMSRYRSLGCSPSTAAILSEAQTLEDIISEIVQASASERNNRAIDKTGDASMEDKKKQGYF